MRRIDDDFDDFDRPHNNFDRMYDAREFDGGNREYRERQDRVPRQRRTTFREEDREYEEQPKPKKRSFFGARHHSEPEMRETPGTNNLVVMTPKCFQDIESIIDNLRANRALIVDLCLLNDESNQRVMDYVNGAIYALQGSIQRISPAVFLMTPAGMGISVPINYIRDKWEKNKKK